MSLERLWVCASLRLALNVEELLADCGVHIDHVTIHRWVRRFTHDPGRLSVAPGTRSDSAGRSMRFMKVTGCCRRGDHRWRFHDVVLVGPVYPDHCPPLADRCRTVSVEPL